MYLEGTWGLGPPTPLVRCIWCFDVFLDLDGDWLGSYDSATKSIFKAVSIVGIKAAEFIWQSVSWSKTWLSNSIVNWTEAFGICEGAWPRPCWWCYLSRVQLHVIGTDKADCSASLCPDPLMQRNPAWEPYDYGEGQGLPPGFSELHGHYKFLRVSFIQSSEYPGHWHVPIFSLVYVFLCLVGPVSQTNVIWCRFNARLWSGQRPALFRTGIWAVCAWHVQ